MAVMELELEIFLLRLVELVALVVWDPLEVGVEVELVDLLHLGCPAG